MEFLLRLLAVVLVCLTSLSSGAASDLNATVAAIQTKLHLLDVEVQNKNDETQDLKKLVRGLSADMEEQKNKTSDLEARVTRLENL